MPRMNITSRDKSGFIGVKGDTYDAGNILYAVIVKGFPANVPVQSMKFYDKAGNEIADADPNKMTSAQGNSNLGFLRRKNKSVSPVPIILKITVNSKAYELEFTRAPNELMCARSSPHTK